MNLHGYIRFTGDLDLLITLDKENISKMDGVMKKLKYSERLPVSIFALTDEKQVKEWLNKKNMKAFTFNPPRNNLLQIDIIIEDSLKFDSYDKKKNVKTMGKLRIPVVSIEDIIKMKKRANREKDILDIKLINNISKL